MAATTHTVTNQVPPLVGYDVFAADRALSEAVERHIEPGVLPVAREELGALGRSAGSAQAQEWGRRRTSIRPFCAPMTVMETGSTKWSSTRPGTGSWATRSPPG